MNPDERFELLWTDFLEGDLDVDGMADLQSLLAHHSHLQARATDLLQTHRLLGFAAQEERTSAAVFASEVLNRLPKTSEAFVGAVMREVRPASPSRPRFPWLAWRPLTAAAAGLVIGLFSASVVWAFAGNGRSWSLLRESFEGDGFRWHSGFPTQLGQWGGDEAKIVTKEAGVAPKEGMRMLKLEPKTTDLSSRTHCIADLQNQQKALGSTTRQIELRASFHPSVLGKKDRYVLRAAAFADGPEKVEERWMNDLWMEIDEHALAYAARGVSVPAGTDGWQAITLMIDVPPGSRILVISMWAATMDGKPDNRSAHYLDDVRLSGVINEPLP